MGLFDVFKNIAKQVKTGITSAASSVEGAFKKALPVAESAGKFVFDQVQTAVNKGEKYGVGVANFVADQYNKNMDTVRGVVSNVGSGAKDVLSGAGKTIGEIGDFIPWIAGLGVAALGVYAYTNSGSGKRSAQNYRSDQKGGGYYKKPKTM
jgi:phage-related protein